MGESTDGLTHAGVDHLLCKKVCRKDTPSFQYENEGLGGGGGANTRKGRGEVKDTQKLQVRCVKRRVLRGVRMYATQGGEGGGG